jgi:arsenate reductase (thioredoxin)
MPDTIVFVCEHGAAKSVVAAAQFNRLAEERHLPYRGIARGTEPQEDIAPSAAAGLLDDGLPLPVQKPVKLTKADIEGAARVVAFCDLPGRLIGDRRVERWSASAVGDGYARAREEIVAQLKKLIASLERR